jgi:hypothetical protein
VTRQGLPPDIVLAYDGIRLVLEKPRLSRSVAPQTQSLLAAEECR